MPGTAPEEKQCLPGIQEPTTSPEAEEVDILSLQLESALPGKKAVKLSPEKPVQYSPVPTTLQENSPLTKPAHPYQCLLVPSPRTSLPSDSRLCLHVDPSSTANSAALQPSAF